jgi:hypothetical protein
MARLGEALRAFGLSGRISPSGRLATLDGERCRVYVVEAPRGGGFYTWCDDPAERLVEHYPDAAAAITAGLRRASVAHRGQSGPEETASRGGDRGGSPRDVNRNVGTKEDR